LKRIGLLIAVAAVAFLIYRHRSGTPPRAGDDGETPLAVETPAAKAAPPRAPASSEAAAENAAPAAPAAPPPPAPAAPAEAVAAADGFPRCPDMQPLDGSACPSTTTASLRCAYSTSSGEVVCDCVSASPGTGPGWRCLRPAPAEVPHECPEAAPFSGTACASVGQLCRYGTAPDAIMCRCQAAGWSCLDYRDWRHKK